MDRIFTLQEYWQRVASEHEPQLSYKNSHLPFVEWAKAARERLYALMGRFPDRVPLNAEIEFSVDQGEYIRQSVVFDTDRFMSCRATVLIPKQAATDGSAPAILCCHGHGRFMSFFAFRKLRKVRGVMGKLEGKVAVITGASKGIGEGIAKMYAKYGAKCVLAASHILLCLLQEVHHILKAYGIFNPFIGTDTHINRIIFSNCFPDGF